MNLWSKKDKWMIHAPSWTLTQILSFYHFLKDCPSTQHNLIDKDLHLLEAPHAVQYVELLPAFGEIDLSVNKVWVSQMDKGQVLQDKTPGTQTNCITLCILARNMHKLINNCRVHSQIRNTRRLHFSQSSSVCSEWGGAVDQCAIFLQSLQEATEDV